MEGGGKALWIFFGFDYNQIYFWKTEPRSSIPIMQMIAVLVDKMIRIQIVDCAAVANWIFSSELAHDFTR